MKWFKYGLITIYCQIKANLLKRTLEKTKSAYSEQG